MTSPMLLCTDLDAAHDLQLSNALRLASTQGQRVELLLLRQPFPWTSFSSANGIGLPQALRAFEQRNAMLERDFATALDTLRQAFPVQINQQRLESAHNETAIAAIAHRLGATTIVLALPERRAKAISKRLHRELKRLQPDSFMLLDDRAAAALAT